MTGGLSVFIASFHTSLTGQSKQPCDTAAYRKGCCLRSTPARERVWHRRTETGHGSSRSHKSGDGHSPSQLGMSSVPSQNVGMQGGEGGTAAADFCLMQIFVAASQLRIGGPRWKRARAFRHVINSSEMNFNPPDKKKKKENPQSIII